MAKNTIILTESILAQSPTEIINIKSIPSWNEAGRPEEPKTGVIGFNSQTKHIEFWNGSRWFKLRMKKI